MTTLLEHGLFVRAERSTEKSNLFQIQSNQTFTSDYYYIWIYEGSLLKTYLIGSSLLGITFAGVMFPLWPYELRIGVWYLSMIALGLLGALLGLSIIRLFIWIGTLLIVRKGGWLFPNLFADVGFFDSFKPLWSWEEKTSSLSGNLSGDESAKDGNDSTQEISGKEEMYKDE